MIEAAELLCRTDETPGRAIPLLAIGIPTRNRREVLEECLASVLPQAEALGVGVCVSDNCSSDGTWEVLEALKCQYPSMQIMRHTRDIGYRGNLIGAVLSSRTRYVWPMGDKDVLLPGALEFLIDGLVRLHPDAVVLNCPGQSASTVERMFSAPRSCFTELGWWTTGLGATVLPRQAWVDVLHAQPASPDFPQVVAFFSYLASLSAPQVLLTGRVLIQRGKFATEHGTSSFIVSPLETLGRNWYNTVMSLPGLYSTNEKLQVVRSYSEHAGMLGCMGLLRLRARGQLTRRQLDADHVPLRAAVSAPWWQAVAISVVPSWMLRLVFSVHPRRMLRAMRSKLRLVCGH
jgi:glycosyltransferase involved in cell wall biosynthesis